MSHPVGYPLRDRIGVHLIEAGVETAFTLVDMAKEQSSSSLSSRVLESAEEVFGDIERRLERLSRAQQSPFQHLVHELRREIDRAHLRASGTDPARHPL
jgi:hypothetical protein